MYGKRFGSLLAEDLTVLQKEEIRQGIGEGLARQEIRLFAKPYYNHMQMKEIRKALKEGIDTRMIRKYWKPCCSYRQMKEMRIAAVSGEALPVKSVIPAVAGGMLIFSLLLCAGFFLIKHPAEQLSLELSVQETQLSVGEMFDPMAYVLSYSGKDALLILPHGVETEKPGSTLAVYQLKGKNKSLTRTLRVTVTDTGKTAGGKEKALQ